jgi:hypothetical protein
LLFRPFRIGYTAVYRAYRGTLWLFVKANTLGTFIWNDIVKFVAYGGLFTFNIYHPGTF